MKKTLTALFLSLMLLLATFVVPTSFAFAEENEGVTWYFINQLDEQIQEVLPGLASTEVVFTPSNDVRVDVYLDGERILYVLLQPHEWEILDEKFMIREDVVKDLMFKVQLCHDWSDVWMTDTAFFYLIDQVFVDPNLRINYQQNEDGSMHVTITLSDEKMEYELPAEDWSKDDVTIGNLWLNASLYLAIVNNMNL